MKRRLRLPVDDGARLRVLVGALAALAVAVTLRNSPTTYLVDNRFDQYWAPGRRLRGSLDLWDPTRSLGRVREDLWPAATLGPGLFRFLGASPAIAEHLWHSSLLLCGGCATVALLRQFRPRVGAEHLLAGVLYMLGPYSATFLVPSNLYLHYSLAPLFALAVYRGLTSDTPWRWAGVFTLGVTVAGNVDAPGLLYSLVPAFVTFLYVTVVVRQTSRGRVMRWIGGTFALTLVANAATLYKVVNGYASYAQNLGGTETPTHVTRNSSWSESWRGLGFWLTYFQHRTDFARPQGLVFVTNALVIVATFLVPVIALLAIARYTNRARLLPAAMMLSSVVLMVGAFPVANSTPYGKLLFRLYDDVPSTIAFRNTYKAGAGLALGGAMLCATAASDMLRYVRARSRRGHVVAGGCVLLVLLPITYPFWSGNLYDETRTVDTIPSYVSDAYRWLDAQPDDERILVLPGSSYTAYRWGNVGDDVQDAFLEQWHTVRTSVLQSGPPASDIIDAIDDYVRTGSMRPGVLPEIARRLGIGYVVVRNDIDWEQMGSPRPLALDPLRTDPDLARVATFGRAGENTTDPSDDSDDAARERRLAPIEVYRVSGVEGAVRVVDGTTPTIVSGNGDSWPQLAEQGLLDEMPAVVYSGSLDDAELAADLGAGAPVVVTDGNRRRATLLLPEPERSHTLAAGDDVGEDIAEPFPREGSQTVAVYPDATRIWDSRHSTGLSGFAPNARPANATDGDPETAWLVSAVDQPLGAALRIDFAREQMVRDVFITRAESSAGGRVATSARLMFSNGYEQDVFLTHGTVHVEVPALSASWVDIAPLTATAGQGAIGFAEVVFPGLDLAERIAVPDDVVRAARRDAGIATSLARVPMHFSFSRARGGGIIPEERAIRRSFVTDSDRVYRFEATGTIPTFATDASSERLRRMLQPGHGGLPRCSDEFVRLDGRPVAVRVLLRSQSEDGALTFSMSSCRTIELPSGAHELETPAPTTLDDIVLVDRIEVAPRVVGEPPAVHVDDLRRAGVDGRIDAPDGGLLVLEQAYDPQWRLQVDGVDLGAPRAVDGLNAWVLPRMSDGAITIDYPHQTTFRQMLGISATAVLLAIGMTILGGRTLYRARSFEPVEEPPRRHGRWSRHLGQGLTIGAALLVGGALAVVPATLLFTKRAAVGARRAVLAAVGALVCAAVATLIEAPLATSRVTDFAGDRPLASAFGRLAAVFLLVGLAVSLLPDAPYRRRDVVVAPPREDNEPRGDSEALAEDRQPEMSEPVDTRSITVGPVAS